MPVGDLAATASTADAEHRCHPLPLPCRETLTRVQKNLRRGRVLPLARPLLMKAIESIESLGTFLTKG
ncbi:hypothetical protein U9M48_039096 [Paspalum notatum var. saurae]|uniref:Uncharacterized protein n=1 Tax=Paspalum notatum var. saurae TaxID=547442 RepID=A0AAQ3XCC0_PASNO